MKVNYRDLLNINASLVYLSKNETDAWLKISRNIKKIKPHLVSFQESNQEIAEKYAEKDKEGNVKSEGEKIIFGKNEDKANEDWAKLMDEMVTVDFVSISQEELTKEGKPFGLDALAVESLIDTIIVE
jgi:hypothetical protein